MNNRINYEDQYSGGVRLIDDTEAEQNIPAGGDTGQVLAKKSGEDLDLEWVTFDVPEAVVPKHTLLMFAAGELEVGTDLFGFVSPYDMEVLNIIVGVKTAPTGADLIFDIHKNGTTMFTTQAFRPTLPEEELTAVPEIPEVVTIERGDVLTLDIDQVGSTIAGENLMVTIVCEEVIFAPL